MRLFLLMLSMLPPISAIKPEPDSALNNGVLTIAIEAREGAWYPDSDKMPGIAKYAFGETGKPLQIPGPLIRGPAGTRGAHAPDEPRRRQDVRVVGLYSRPYLSGNTVIGVAPNQSQDVEFTLDTPGTYYYWGTANDPAFNRRVVVAAGFDLNDARGRLGVQTSLLNWRSVI